MTYCNLLPLKRLYEHFRKTDFNAYGWTSWPIAFQSPNSDEVKAFQQDNNAERIDYFCYVQWLAHRQLKSIANKAELNWVCQLVYTLI